MRTKVAVMGAGSWGTALAIHLSKIGHEVSLWTRFQEDADLINIEREQPKYLKGVRIPEEITCYIDEEEALEGKEIVVMAVPSQAIRENVQNISRLLNKERIIVSVAKGLEEKTLLRLSEVIEEEVSGAKFVALSGPSHAEEVAVNIPTTVVAASNDINNARKVQDIFMGPSFRVYTNDDLTGVEIGGALKNVIALCAGISDGIGFGDNTKAALMTRGLTEIARLGESLGAKKQTFAGLTGMGDLIVTCTSMHSRNRRAGMLIGQGKSVEEALSEVKMVVEGIRTTGAAHKLAAMQNVEMPITEQAYRILFEGDNPKKAVAKLMEREKKHEIEDVFVI
ncbi:MAG: NAD(P)H-dependent glycerol-3-phosphate dehydrogenase [Deltaproteobacteria bacterium]